jgi:hypothetical protein
MILASRGLMRFNQYWLAFSHSSTAVILVCFGLLWARFWAYSIRLQYQILVCNFWCFAKDVLGHIGKAVHQAYSRKAGVELPSLGEYERQ